jgi:hypothetical protein
MGKSYCADYRILRVIALGSLSAARGVICLIGWQVIGHEKTF